MSQQSEEQQPVAPSNPIPLLTIEEISQSRQNTVNNFNNTQTSAMNLINSLGEQHILLLNELKAVREQLETANTQLQVSNVENVKLKEKLKKPNTQVVKETETIDKNQK